MTGSGNQSFPDWLLAARTGLRAGGPQLRPKESNSPFFNREHAEWPEITRKLLSAHPLSGPQLVDTVLMSWDAIFESSLGSGFRIGIDIWPVPQVMGFLLHALIPLELAKEVPGWRADTDSTEKDLVFIKDNEFSMEIKTSSHPNQIFGNRSYGIVNPGKGKKAKDGYYLTVNFEKWHTDKSLQPRILLIRYGWLDHTDWVAQTAETGQQSSLPSVVDNYQLLTIYDGSSNWRA